MKSEDKRKREDENPAHVVTPEPKETPGDRVVPPVRRPRSEDEGIHVDPKRKGPKEGPMYPGSDVSTASE